jgi:hypothetical protein
MAPDPPSKAGSGLTSSQTGLVMPRVLRPSLGFVARCGTQLRQGIHTDGRFPKVDTADQGLYCGTGSHPQKARTPGRVTYPGPHAAQHQQHRVDVHLSQPLDQRKELAERQQGPALVRCVNGHLHLPTLRAALEWHVAEQSRVAVPTMMMRS